MDPEPRHAVEVLTEALGLPRRRMLSSGPDDTLDTVAWDCGCRAQASRSDLRRWRPCCEHAAFRDAVMARLAVVSARGDD